jgi:acetoacetate decarboxylase
VDRAKENFNPNEERAMNAMRWMRWVGLLGLLTVVLGWARPAGADPAPPPPYEVNSHHVLIGVAYDEAVVRKLLPPGIKAVEGAPGMINIYVAEDASGLGPFSSFLLMLNVEGFDSVDGNKGSWMLAGAYSPEKALSALTKYHGYPAREGTARLERTSDTVRAVGTLDGKDVIRAEIKLKSEPCKRFTGTQNEPARKPNSDQFQITRIPYIDEVCFAELIALDVLAPKTDVIGQLAPLKVLWAAEAKANFAFTPPVNAR